MTRPNAGQQAVDAPQIIEQLLLPVLPRGYNYALRLTRDEFDAEDLLQEAATRACQFFHQFQAGTNFRAWFFKILTNCFYNRERQDRRRGKRLSIEDTPALYLYTRTAEAGLHERDSNPAAAFLTRLDTEQIARALNELPEEFRTVAVLYFVEDLKYEEISGVMGIPLGTVQSRLHRGRRMLQKKLWDVALEHGLVPKTAGDWNDGSVGSLHLASKSSACSMNTSIASRRR
jgi:RNA polymerase sigma-70 factor (ECF subfamily)